MHKTSVYTLANSNIKELEHWKQQKSQKVILPTDCVNLLLNNIGKLHRKDKSPLTQGLNNR